MRVRRTLLVLALLDTMMLTLSPVAAQQTPAFLETFNGNPDTPTAYSPPGWDVAIHSRDSSAWTSLEPMDADHGPACEAPPATHLLTGDYPSVVFQCHDHVMTAISAHGYGEIMLTPPAMVDFSAGEAVIRWDMSTLRTSLRDWADVWVMPWDDQLQLPLEAWLPDLNGEPRNAVHVRMDQFNGGTTFSATTMRDFVVQDLPGNWWTGLSDFLPPDATRRDTFELRISRTHLKFWMPTYNQVWIDTDIADLGWSSGVVQFGHHSYNPTKDCVPSGQLTCQPNTWHWDNVSISPYLPLTITRLSPRFSSGGTHYIFPTTQGGDVLRFSAIGTPSLSFDGAAFTVVAANQPTSHPEHFSSYLVPLPPGSTSVDVALGPMDWYAGPFAATDFAVLAKRQPTPTVSPPPNGTSTPTPTSTPIPTSTATVVPTTTSTVVPTPTPTAPSATICEVNVRLNGIEQGWQFCSP